VRGENRFIVDCKIQATRVVQFYNNMNIIEKYKGIYAPHYAGGGERYHYIFRESLDLETIWSPYTR
jgi:hypothetical protein